MPATDTDKGKAKDKDNLLAYYGRRAGEFERVYQKPERQKELARMRTMIQCWLAGREVLEVACGTGYWTQVAARTAKSILATDAVEETLAVAKAKPYGPARVTFLKADAYTLAGVAGTFSAALAGFWWSHVPRSRQQGFLDVLHGRLAPGARVVLMDNNYVAGSNNPMAQRTDEEGNTYSQRRLSDGTAWEILKNFPTQAQLHAAIAGRAEQIEYINLTYYWLLSYCLPGGERK